MQTWHCIVLIALTIGGFMYATFLNEIDRESELTLERLGASVNTPLATLQEPQIEFGRGNDADDGTWAKKVLLLQAGDRNSPFLDLHRSALGGEFFLQILLKELESVKNVREQIFSAFRSELHSIDEKTILESLVSIIPESKQNLEIICRGHSKRTADLLAEFILRTYPKALAFEKKHEPLLPELREKLSAMSKLEKEAGELKLVIHEELKEAPEDSIEVMALQSEIFQIDQDVGNLKVHLVEIDSIHRNKEHPLKYLDVRPIAQFGKVADLSDILSQLKLLSSNPDLNDFTREEVKKNIETTSKSLEAEVVEAIGEIKSRVKSLLNRKKELQKSVIDAIESHRLSIAQDPAVAKLSDIRERLAELQAEFDERNLQWIRAKKSFSLVPKP